MKVEKTREKAEEYYASGSFLCSEAVVKAVCEEVGGIPVDVATRAASAFPGGFGSGCTCGALAGGAMVIGLYHGRDTAHGDNSKVMRLSSELHNKFKVQNGSTCCRVLTRKFDKSKGEHKSQCQKFTGEVAQWVAETISEL